VALTPLPQISGTSARFLGQSQPSYLLFELSGCSRNMRDELAPVRISTFATQGREYDRFRHRQKLYSVGLLTNCERVAPLPDVEVAWYVRACGVAHSQLWNLHQASFYCVDQSKVTDHPRKGLVRLNSTQEVRRR
jgi:hypothetical protein